MLKVLNTKQIRELDTFTIENEPISSIDLMERACQAFATWFAEKFNTTKNIGIVCGTGNNGGDGLASARMLHEMNYSVKVWIVRGTVSESLDFIANLKRLQGKVEIYEITSASDRGLFSDCAVLIDAIFGSGLSRPVDGIYAQAIACMNQTNAIRIAVDIPSGLMADSHSADNVVHAHYTVSFQLPKLAFFLPENYPYTGEWYLLNIGLNKECIASADTSYFLMQKSDIIKIKKKRSRFEHKGNFGKALIIAGSYGKIGAAVLSARAAMHAGLGLLTVHIPQCGYTILQTAFPEAMASTDKHDKFFTECPPIEEYDAVSIGPGLGTEPETVKAFASVLERSQNPMVIDADGINILSKNRELVHIIPQGSILTPHPKEFERLVGNWKNDFERLGKLQEFAVQTKTTVILKGAYTSIASPDGKVYFNPTGNPGMATGGSGDALTGILTGILAQHYNPLQTAQLGVYLHGLAGDLAAEQNGMDAMIASDLINFIPNALIDLGS